MRTRQPCARTSMALLLLLTACSPGLPTPPQPEDSGRAPYYDPVSGLTLQTLEGDLVRARMVHAEELLLSITAADGESFETLHRPGEVLQRARARGREEKLLLRQRPGFLEARFDGQLVARSDELRRRPAAWTAYEKSRIYENPLAERMYATLNDESMLPTQLKRLIIDDDGYCRAEFTTLLMTCIEGTCFIPNPLCSGCIGALTACVMIAIILDWPGGRR